MGGLFGGGETKSTTEYTMSPEQRQMYALALPFMKQFGKTPLKLPEGSGVQGFDPLQEQAQQMAVTSAMGGQSDLAKQGMQASNFMMGDVLSPESNPYLAKYMKAATDPIAENLTQNLLPNIRADATKTGQFGGTGRALAEGDAWRQSAKQIGDTSSQIASQGYGQGLQAMQSAVSNLPQTMAAQLMPASTVAAVGEQKQQLAQTILNEIRNRFMQEQTLPYMQGSMIMNALQAIPGGTSVTTGQGGQSSPFSQILGAVGTIGSLFF